MDTGRDMGRDRDRDTNTHRKCRRRRKWRPPFPEHVTARRRRAAGLPWLRVPSAASLLPSFPPSVPPSRRGAAAPPCTTFGRVAGVRRRRSSSAAAASSAPSISREGASSSPASSSRCPRGHGAAREPVQESQAEQQGAELGERAGGAPVGGWACRGRGAGREKRPSAAVMWQYGGGSGSRDGGLRAPLPARTGRDAERGRGGANPVTERRCRGPGGSAAEDPRGAVGKGRKPLRRGPGICRFHPCLFRREPSASSVLEEGRLKNAMYNVAIHKPGLAKDWGSLYGECYVENCRDTALKKPNQSLHSFS